MLKNKNSIILLEVKSTRFCDSIIIKVNYQKIKTGNCFYVKIYSNIIVLSLKYGMLKCHRFLVHKAWRIKSLQILSIETSVNGITDVKMLRAARIFLKP